MDIQELISMLTDGLDADQAKIVKAAIERDSVKTKTVSLRQQKDLDAIEAKRAELEAELVGDGQNKVGAREYAKWVEANRAEIARLAKAETDYKAKYGALDAATTTQTTTSTDTKTPVIPAGLSKEDIDKAIDARIRDGYAPRWSSLLTGTGSIVQKHMYAGRKTPIDFKKIEEIAGKYNGDLEQAYDEYDKPEREKELAAKTEGEIKRRVSEELQKRGVQANFPGGADVTPGALSVRSNSNVPDKAAMEKDLVNTFITGRYPGEGDASGSRGKDFFGSGVN